MPETKSLSPEERKIRRAKQKKEWKQNNPEKIAEYSKRYREKYRERLNARDKAYYYKNAEKEKAREYKRYHTLKETHPEMLIFRRAKRRAQNRGIEFTITIDDIHIPSHCPIFGIPLYTGTGKMSDNSPSIDRIDNDRGYIPGNVIVISSRANTIKCNGTADEHRRIADFMSSYGYY